MSVRATVDLAEEGAPETGSEREPTLRVDGLTVFLSGREVLRDVSFSLAAGELTGLIGMNGAGKTTLLRAVLGLQPISSGEVRLAGGRLGRRSVGYVPQKVVLDPDLPVRARDLVELGMDGRRLGIPLRSRTKRAVVDDLLSSVDVLHLADARVGALSGGEQQRVLIAHGPHAALGCSSWTNPWPTWISRARRRQCGYWAGSRGNRASPYCFPPMT